MFAQTKYKIMYRYAAKASRTVKKQQQVWLAKKAHFFVHFFAVVLYDYNVKLPETS